MHTVVTMKTHMTSSGQRRVSPRVYKLLLTVHIMTSVGWLGVILAKLALALAAAAAESAETAHGLLVGVNAINVAFAPASTGAIVSGVLLALGTRWGVVRYYWVVAKIVLTVGVFGTAVQLVPRLLELRIDEPMLLGVPWAPAVLVIFAALHLLMLGAATVLGVYKPWGMTWFARQSNPSGAGQSRGRAATATSTLEFNGRARVGRIA